MLTTTLTEARRHSREVSGHTLRMISESRRERTPGPDKVPIACRVCASVGVEVRSTTPTAHRSGLVYLRGNHASAPCGTAPPNAPVGCRLPSSRCGVCVACSLSPRWRGVVVSDLALAAQH